MDNEIQKNIIAAIRLLWQKDFLAAGDGNFSYKTATGDLYITPSGCRKCDLTSSDFVNLQNSKQASSEALMHKKVYEKTDQAQVVFHAHPVNAIAYSINHEDKFLPDSYLSELILSVGKVPVIEYARPSTEQMAMNIEPFLPECRVLLLKHHGALTWGESVSEALNGMERLEHTCKILNLLSEKTATKLPAKEIAWLYEKRKNLGEKIL